MADAKIGAKLFKDGDLAPSCGGPDDRFNFAVRFVVAKARTEDVIRRNNVLKRRLDDFLRRGGDLLARDFDQTLSFNDSGVVLSELIGFNGFHDMMHVNQYDGLTIAVSEAKFITRVARRTVLSANAMSVLVPVLEKVMNWDSAKIRRFFASYGLALLEWEKMRTDILTIQDSAVPVAPASDASAASPQIDAH